MVAPSGIGDQLGRLRTMRGLSQERLAERADVSVDVIRRLEQGVRDTARLDTLSCLAEALGAQVSVLLVPSTPESGPGAAEHLEAVRKVLTTPDALVGFAELCDDDMGEPNIAALQASAETMWSLYQEGEYVAVSALLPDLITEARHAARELVADERVAAFAVLATAFQASAGVAITLGKEDLAFIAVERAVTAAEECGDPLHRAAAANFLSWIYRRHGRLADAEEVATRAAERCEPRWLAAPPEQVSVFGGLLLNASGAAARAQRAQRSRELSRIARAAAAQAAGDRVDRWAVFGPSVAARNEVNNAVEYGELDEALRLAHQVPARGRVPATWSARYLLNVAYLRCEYRQSADALATLQEVRRLAPEWIRYHPQARGVVDTLLARKGRPAPELIDLAAYLQG